MVHVWRLHGLEAANALVNSNDRERFVYWFYDTFHRVRAPYRWPVPPDILRWLNHPVLDLSANFADAGMFPKQPYYLTRFMLHVWKHFREDTDVRDVDGYLRFLTWFVLECVPAWNLPPALVPAELLGVLNDPVRDGWPMSRAMYILGELHGVQSIRDVPTGPEDAALALSFELLKHLLQAGDPRLVPSYVSRYWSAPISPEQSSPTTYEYVASQAWGPRVADHATIHSWFSRRFLTVLPQAGVFTPAPSSHTHDMPGAEHVAPAEKIVVVYRDHHTIAGLATAGAIAREALSRAGLPIVDLDFALGRDRMLEEHRSNSRVLRHARSSLHILNLNPEYIPECLMCHLADLEHARYIIGQLYWELSDISSVHECGLSLLDEIWVATEYLKEIYQRTVSIPVHVMGQAVEPPARTNSRGRTTLGLPSDAYVFLFTFDAGSGVERKNPLAAVNAFKRAFPKRLGWRAEKPVLVIKTRNAANLEAPRDRAHWARVLALAAGDPRIRIIDSTMTGEEMAGLKAACDCYVSLHRSEGFGYGPAEAMSIGKPVITTAYSGVTDFCTAHTALLVDFTLERVPSGAYPYMDEGREYHWAAPNLAMAADQMRTLYENRTLGKQLGDAGREVIRQRYSVASLQRRYVQRLSELGWL